LVCGAQLKGAIEHFACRHLSPNQGRSHQT
jgi:hypothetical protein